MYIGCIAVCRHIPVQGLYIVYTGPAPVYGLYIGKYRAVHRQIQRYRPIPRIYGVWACTAVYRVNTGPAGPVFTGPAGLGADTSTVAYML